MIRLLSAFILLLSIVPASCKAAVVPGVDPSVLVVSGHGIAKRAPDVAVITIGAEAIETSVETAQAKVNAAINAAKSAIVQLGVAKGSIRTSGLSVSSVYEEQEKPSLPKLIGYRAVSTLRIRMEDVSLAGKVIDAAISNGVTELDGICFGLKDSSAEQTQALTHAVANARVKAHAIASALDLELVEVLEVADEDLSYGGGGQSYFDEPSSTEIEPGEVVVEAKVGVRFRIASKKQS